MKKLVLLLTAVLLCSPMYSQNHEKEFESKSTMVELLKKDGTLLVKDFFDIGRLPGVGFQNIILTDISEGSKSGALRMETSFYSSVGTDTYIGTLDFDELEGCLKSLRYIKENIINTIPENYTECVYTTRDGVSLGVYLNDTKKVKKWELFIKTKSYTARSQEFMEIKYLDEFISLIEKSKENLKLNME